MGTTIRTITKIEKTETIVHEGIVVDYVYWLSCGHTANLNPIFKRRVGDEVKCFKCNH